MWKMHLIHKRFPSKCLNEILSSNFSRLCCVCMDFLIAVCTWEGLSTSCLSFRWYHQDLPCRDSKNPFSTDREHPGHLERNKHKEVSCWSWFGSSSKMSSNSMAHLRFGDICFFQTGKLDPHYPKICGHKGNVLDIKWNPFNDFVIASCSEDATVSLPACLCVITWLMCFLGKERKHKPKRPWMRCEST